MEVDETMFPGQFHHPRFIGERGGRQQQCLAGENSLRSTGWSTRSLAEDAAGRVAKRHFAGACRMRSTRTAGARHFARARGLWSTKSPARYYRLSGPWSRRGRARVSRRGEALGLRVGRRSRFAPFLAKKVFETPTRGSNPGKLRKG